MIDRNQVISVYEELYNTDEFEGRIMPLCQAVCLSVEAKMKKGADSANPEIIMLAAALLNRRVVSRVADDDAVTSFRAGDVTVSKKTETKLKEAEREVELSLIRAAHLLRDDSFLFIRC